jgi:hypothetical protein
MAVTPPFRIKVEGYKEFAAAVRRAQGELPKKMGQLHKDIGAMVISRLTPKAVGTGAGAQVRPSASKREILIRVGGAWRGNRARQWGKRQVWPNSEPPKRPDILGTARRNQDRIEQMLMQGIEDHFKPPFE